MFVSVCVCVCMCLHVYAQQLEPTKELLDLLSIFDLLQLESVIFRIQPENCKRYGGMGEMVFFLGSELGCSLLVKESHV